MSKWYPCVYCTEDLHCTKYEEPGYESWCVLGPCTAETPSHGDLIRRMSDEELAEHFSGRCCPVKDAFYNCVTFDQESCKRCWLVWLRSPTEDSHEP